MSTTYNPSPTATQAPATQPDPDAFPALTLPASGDGATAASVAQAYKALGDYIAWGRAPRAKASSWIQAIQKYMNAALQTRFVIDHMGFPAGKMIQWNEDFGTVQPVAMVGPISAAVLNNSRWGVQNFTTGNITVFSAGGAYSVDATLVTPMVALLSGLAVGGCQLYLAQAAIVHTTDLAISYQWDAYLQGTDAGSAEPFGGLLTTQLSASGAISAIAPTGVGFIKRVGDTNWFAYVNGAYTSTGVAASSAVRRRFRIEVIGAAASDAGAAQVIFYIDGNLVAQSAAAPLLGLSVVPLFRNARTAVGTSTYNFWVGTNDFRANTWAGNVAM